MSQYILTDIGLRLRDKRKEASLTLAALADKANISKSLLSKIENGRTVPSLPVLLNLIQCLDLTPEEFFRAMHFGPAQPYTHVRPEDCVDIDKEEDAKGFRYRRVMTERLGDMTVEVVRLDIEPGSERAMVTTDALEFKYVIAGKLDYHLNEEVLQLQEGDVLFYDGRQPHVPVNTSDEKATMLVLYFFDKG